MLLVILTALMLTFSGCAGTKSSSGHKAIRAQDSYFLSADEDHARRIDIFFEEYSTPTEVQKIEYLLNSIKQSGAVFIRNGEQYNSKQATKWLAWKAQHPQYKDNPILTAWDFVNRVADGSKATGWPYEIILTDGTKLHCQVVLSNELRTLELRYVQQPVVKSPLTEVVPESLSVNPKLPDEKVPQLLNEENVRES